MAKENCFIIAPISTLAERAALYLNDSAHSEHVMDHLLAPAVEEAGFEPIKPKAKGANLIHAEIVQNLQTASLVLCDMSGLNPNVFFELGIRTAMNKPVCLTIDEATNNPPFDLGSINHHKYNSDLRPWILPDEITKLATHIRDSAHGNENALWKYFALRLTANETGASAPTEKLDLLIEQVDALRRQTPSDYSAHTLAWPVAELWAPDIKSQATKRGITVTASKVVDNETLLLTIAPAKAEVVIELKKYALSRGVNLVVFTGIERSASEDH